MDITEPNIWYREELQCFIDMVRAEIKRLGDRATVNERITLGALYDKLTRAIEVTPGMAAS